MTRWAPWVLALALIVAALWMTHRLNVATQASDALATALETADLERQGYTVETEVTIADLAKRVKAAEARIPELTAALDKARKAAGGAVVVEIIEAHSGPLEATGSVAFGDKVELRQVGVTLRYEHGSRVHVIAAEAWNVTRNPPLKIVAGELTVTADGVLPAPVPSLGWGAGVAGFASPGGWAAGLAVSPPPLTLGPLTLEAIVSVEFGTAGPVVGGDLLGRF